MAKEVTVSAPGKLMLLGEHAVVYGHPCIVTAVDQRMWATIALGDKPEFVLDAPDVGIVNYHKPMSEVGAGDIPKDTTFVEIAVKNFLDFIKENRAPTQVRRNTPGLKIATKSEFSSQFGFGSSSATSVCVVKALSELFDIQLSNKELFNVAYKTVLDIQGKGSGFDVAAAIYGGTLYFVTGGEVIEPLRIKNLPLIVGYSGVKADTVTIVNKVKEKFADRQEAMHTIFDAIEILVKAAKQQLIAQDFKALGQLMNEDQKYLSKLGVSTPILDVIIDAALASGAYGAKLSGAGGGDCMIALAPTGNIAGVKKAIQNAGGEIVEVRANAQGVRIDVPVRAVGSKI